MVKRISLVWKKADLTRAAFREIWLGEHVEVAKRLPGLREYAIDFVEDGPEGGPDAIATVIFDSRAELDAAFAIPDISAELRRTRDQFAASVKVLFVDQCTVVGRSEGKS